MEDLRLWPFRKLFRTTPTSESHWLATVDSFFLVFKPNPFSVVSLRLRTGDCEIMIIPLKSEPSPHLIFTLATLSRSFAKFVESSLQTERFG